MSLLPYFYESSWPRRLLDQNFGLTLTPEDLLTAATSPIATSIKPWWPTNAGLWNGSSIKADKNNWQINVDVQHFSPDEITVKIANGDIIVEGKHEEKQDEHGFISRQFVRRFKLPEDINADVVESRLSSDGVLTVVAPKNSDTLTCERSVPIIETGPVKKERDE